MWGMARGSKRTVQRFRWRLLSLGLAKRIAIPGVAEQHSPLVFASVRFWTRMVGGSCLKQSMRSTSMYNMYTQMSAYI